MKPEEVKSEEPMVGGVPHRLLDGYDGGVAPPEEFMKKLLEGAPPEIKARAEEFAKQRAGGKAAAE